MKSDYEKMKQRNEIRDLESGREARWKTEGKLGFRFALIP
jgi:hypothetical protein